MVQTIGSAGESLAAGAIFTIPALFMWANETGDNPPGFLEISLIALCGGLLGVLFMVPLRNMLIVREKNTLTFPEGTACAKVLLAAEQAGEAVAVFAGLFIGAVYKFIADGLKIFPSEVDYSLKRYKGAGVGADVLPALLGVGYICGPKVASYLFAGGVLGWFVIMPLLVLAGGNSILFPAGVPISKLDTWGIWGNYVRYIGAGAVATGGIISLVKSIPLIWMTFQESLKGYKRGEADAENETAGGDKMEKDSTHDHTSALPGWLVFWGIVVLAVALWLIPGVPVNLAGAILIVVFGFFFATVSSRMVGLVGSSNNPVSGMAIATLLISTFLLKLVGNRGMEGMIAAICIGTVICIIAAMAGDTSQDLKTGYLVGATPVKQQIGEMIGVVASAFTIGGVLYLLNMAWGYGSSELPAPQATLMKMVVEGVMEGNLPWNLVFAGVAVAAIIEILQLPVLPFAVGLYLPIHLSVPIMAGGILRLVYEKRNEKARERGILYASGMIAGEGLVGILLAVCAMIPVGTTNILDKINLSDVLYLGNAGGIVFFGILIATMVYFMERKGKR